MCGIFGVFGGRNVVKDIFTGLTRLEYRGYDSSGLSILEGNKIQTFKAQGKLENLKKILGKKNFKSSIAIGHTRWATHGVPSKKNAHPHTTDDVSIVHNGIIENFTILKKELINKGFIFNSQTDSEVIAHLLTHYLSLGFSPEDSLKKTLPKLEGAFSIAVV